MSKIAQLKTPTGGRDRVKMMMAPLALTVAMLTGIGWYIQETSKVFKRIWHEEMQILEVSNNLIYFDEALTMSARMAASTGDLRWEKRYREFEPQGNAALEKATQLLPELFQGKTMAEANTAAAKLFEIENRALNLVQKGNRQAAAALLATEEYESNKKIFADRMNQIVTAMKNYVESSLQAQAQQASLAVIIVGAALVILLLSWLSVIRTLIRYIWTMDDASSAISTTTTQIASAMEQQDRMVAKQAVSVNQTTTAMNELAVSSGNLTDRAESAASGAQQALAMAEGGTKAVDRTLEGMAILKEKVEAIAQQIESLRKQNYQIGSISTLVTDLANQTHILSLNAAVEAARAGEYGKGFAVVAGEIRQLAAQSKNSAQKINTLVNDIQSTVYTTVRATDEGKQTVTEGVKIARETAAAFTGVANSIDTIVYSSQQISLTAKQQAIAITQVVEAMNALNREAVETASAIGQTKVGTQQLNEAALNLKALV